MAGAILTSLLKRLSNSTLKASSSSSTGHPSWAEQELQKLERTMRRIHAVLQDAEEKDISDRSEQLRLRELKEVAYDAEDAVDEYEYEVLHAKVEARRRAKATTHMTGNMQVMLDLNSYHPKVPISDELAGRVQGIRQRFEEITDEWNRIGVCLLEKGGKRRCTKKWKPGETASWFDEAKTFGREDEKNEIIKWLLQDEKSHSVTVIGIVGMGGLGKTTLAQMIYNDTRVRRHFNLRGWVYVYEDFDVAEIVKKICLSFVTNTGHTNELDSINLMSLDGHCTKLKAVLDGKKFFLVLDDVWNKNPELWSSLKTHLVSVGVGKILVTSRNERAAKIMQTTSHINLSHLSFDHCWMLFKKIAYEGRDHNFLEIGKKIVDKCRGLPLAVKVLAGILRLEDEEEAWVDLLESELRELDEENDGIFPVLKLSYEHLSVELKQCFLYLSLFPKDSNIDKSSTVRQWMSHGFIESKEKKMEEDVGDDYFHEFLHRSILQKKYGEMFIMHDLIHDLAQSLAKDEYLLLTSLESHLMISKRIRHVSLQVRFIRLESWQIIMESLREAEHLRTLILIIDDGIPYMNFLSNLTCLRTLVLPKWFREDLSEAIGSMKHLRYLDIGYCRSIPASVYKLYHIHSLVFSSPGIKLSTDIVDLINLRHLIGYIQCPLPREVVGLRNLQTLPSINLGDGDELLKLKDLKGLPNLRGSVDIGLETVAWGDITPPESYLKDKRGIKTLTLLWGEEVINMDDRLAAQVLDSLQPHRNLTSVHIDNYPGVVLPTWLGRDLPALKDLWIERARKVKSFVVEVEKESEELCHGLSSPAAAAACTEDVESRRCFPSLETLGLTKMDELEEWQAAEDRHLPCLRRLTISFCPKLRKLPSLSRLEELWLAKADEMEELQGAEDRHLRCLRQLSISGCPKLRKLPPLPFLTNLRCVHQFSSDLLTNLPMLRRLRIEMCSDERLILPDDGSLDLLEELYIKNCSALRCVGFSGLASLQRLVISDCALDMLSIRSCPALTSVSGPSGLASLRQLVIHDCPLLSTWRPTTGDTPLSTSLHQLEILRCPLLRISPDERLPPDLHDVKISESPGAEEWYQNQVLSISERQATSMEQETMTT